MVCARRRGEVSVAGVAGVAGVARGSEGGQTGTGEAAHRDDREQHKRHGASEERHPQSLALADVWKTHFY